MTEHALSAVRRNMPARPDPLVSRAHLVEEIHRSLQGRFEMVVLVGEALTGKSEIAAEYVRQHPENSIAIFLGDHSVLRSANYLKLAVYEQVSAIVGTGPDENRDGVTDAQFQRALFNLQKKARRDRSITIVVDGLAQGGGVTDKEIQELLELLPVGWREFKFFVTCEEQHFKAAVGRRENVRRLESIPVSPDEARQYFGGLIDDAKTVDEIRQFCVSSIGRLRRIRDLLVEGRDIATLLQGGSSSLDSIFDFEWAQIEGKPHVVAVLSFVCFAHRPLASAEIAALTGLGRDAVATALKDCRWIFVQSVGEEIVASIESKPLRLFISRRLQSVEKNVRDSLLRMLLAEPNAADSIQNAPSYFAELGKNRELIDRLDAQHFARVLETERTLRALQMHAEYGCRASQQIGDHASEVAFSLIHSAFTGLTFSVATDDHIRALVELGREESAIELASIAPTAEERLSHLAAAANVIRRKSGVVPGALGTRIKELVDAVDVAALGELGVDICTSLVPVNPPLASKLLERILARARIESEEAVAQKLREKPLEDDSTVDDERRNSRIPSEKLADYYRALSNHFRETKPDLLLKFLASETPKVALSLAQQWLAGNLASADAYRVANAALDYMLAATDRTPDLADLRAIAAPLEHGVGAELIELATRIDTQFRSLQKHGTNFEAVRLQLRILRAKSTASLVDSELIDLHSDVCSLQDLSTRASCWAWFIHHMESFPDKSGIEERIELVADVRRRLWETISELLDASADHYMVARESIVALARSSPGDAMNLCSRLNTVASRDKAYQTLAMNLVRYHTASDALAPTVLNIKDTTLRSETIRNALAFIREAAPSATVHPTTLSLWQGVGVALYRVQCISYVAVIAHRQGMSDLVEQLTPQLETVWDAVHSRTARVQLGYLVSRDMATVKAQLGEDWLHRTKQLIEGKSVPSDPIVDALYTTTRLAVRLFYPKTADARTEIGGIGRLIESVADCQYQVNLWSDLIIRLFFSGFEQLSKEICEQRLWRLMDLGEENRDLRVHLVKEAAAALYLCQPGRLRAEITTLPRNQRDAARANIAHVLWTRAPHREPFHNLIDAEFAVDVDTMHRLTELAQETESDFAVFERIKELCRSLVSDRNKASLQRNLVLDQLGKLERLANAKLPDPENIKHEGFLIAALVEVLAAKQKVQGISAPQATPQWEGLYDRARALSNVADRAVVTAMVGAKARCKQGSRVDGWFAQVKADLLLIPSGIDRLDRHEWIARIVNKSDKAAARTLLADAMNESKILPESSEVDDNRRSLLDLAHAIDPALAQNLLARLDDDEARREPLRRRLEASTKRKEVAKAPNSTTYFGMDDSQVAQICFDNLASLNANRIPPNDLESFLHLNRRAKSMPISEAYWVWCWICESARRKQIAGGSDRVRDQLFAAAERAAEIGSTLVSGVPDQLALDDGPFRPGDRESFLAVVRNWAREHAMGWVYLADPYFSPSDLDLVRLLAEAAPEASFRVLTSKETIRKKQIGDVADAFRDAWEAISDVEPPLLEIGVVGFGAEGKSPIHDRWLLSTASGLALGSSVGAIGNSRVSDVEKLSAESAGGKLREVASYFEAPPRIFNGERLTCSVCRV